MAIDSSDGFNQTRDQIITDALQLLGILGQNETATANAITQGSNHLNKIIKRWEAKGYHACTETEATIFLNVGQNTYELNSSTGTQASNVDVEGTLTATAANGATSLTVSSIVGISDDDIIGIELDNGTRQWNVVSGSPSGSTINLDSALTGQASSGNTVFSFTTQMDRPLEITSIRYMNNYGIERPLMRMGHREYMDMPNKTIQAVCTAYYYSPQISSGALYLWPTPNNVEDRLKVTYLRSLEDMDSGTDNPDFPTEWLDPITLILARRLAPAYGIDLKTQNPDLLGDALQAEAEMDLWDSETASIRIIPNNRT